MRARVASVRPLRLGQTARSVAGPPGAAVRARVASVRPLRLGQTARSGPMHPLFEPSRGHVTRVLRSSSKGLGAVPSREVVCVRIVGGGVCFHEKKTCCGITRKVAATPPGPAPFGSHISAICGPFWELDAAAESPHCELFSVDGASASRFQMSAICVGGESWKAQREAQVDGVRSKLIKLGLAGWVGCDMHGHVEVFLITPLPAHILVFEGFEGGQH